MPSAAAVVRVAAAMLAFSIMTALETASAQGTTTAIVTRSGPVIWGRPAISADGRFVAFESSANDLVAGDTNGSHDIFVQDRQTGIIERVSVSSSGIQGNLSSHTPDISADGRFVAFVSAADNLVSGDTNAAYDVFVRDRVGGTTERVNVGPLGVEANHGGGSASISGDGRFVAFSSEATNLVPGDTFFVDVYVRDRLAGVTTKVSVSSDGATGNTTSEHPAISADGRFVAFSSGASNLVAGDTNGVPDVFVHDLVTASTTRVSVAFDGTQASGTSRNPAISGGGRFVAFESLANNLDAGEPLILLHIYVHDRETGTTSRISLDWRGAPADGDSTLASISDDGRYVAFESVAPNVVPNDTNEAPDVFVRDLQRSETTRVSVNWLGVQTRYGGTQSSICGDGRYVVFQAGGFDLVQGSSDPVNGIFLHDRRNLPVHDMNGDGQTDLVWHHRGDGRLAAWLMNGTTLLDGRPFAPGQVTDTSWQAAGTGDLDGDRRTDIVWHNVADGRTSVWVMNGLTLREGLVSWGDPMFSPWSIASVGDLNHDGKADLIWHNRGDGQIRVWLMDREAVQRVLPLDPSQVPDTNWWIVGSADFDRNGSRDLVWHHQGDGRLAIWLMEGLTMLRGLPLNPGQVPDTTWQIRSVGDLDGDGRPDLIWQNTIDGRISAWLMNGLDAVSGVLLSPSIVPDTNWHIIGPR